MRGGPWLDVLALARREGEWSARVSLAALPRLRAVVAGEADAELGEVQVQLGFRVDDSGRVRVAGECETSAVIACARCMEDVAVSVRASVDARVVRSEAEASELIADCDVIVAPSREVEVAQLIEDDLLLGLPETGCGKREPCPNAPSTEYPAPDGEVAVAQAGPFDALAALKVGGTDDG